MFSSKLGVRVLATVLFSILFIALVIGFLAVSRQKERVQGRQTEVLASSVALVDKTIHNAVRHSRNQELADLLEDLASRFQASSYILVDLKGKPLAEKVRVEGYTPHPGNPKEELPRIESHIAPPSQFLPGGTVRCLFPLHDGAGALSGGLEMELPLSLLDPESQERVTETLWTLGGVTLAILLFVTLILWPTFNYFVIRPIHEMGAELEQLSRGDADLTLQVRVSTHDEIGAMAGSFNQFLGRIRAMVLRIMEHSEHLTEQVQSMSHSTAEVSAMSEDVTTTVQQIAKGAEEQAAKIAELNQLMQETQDTMREVERKAHETSNAVDRATQTAKAGGKLTRDAIGRMASVNDIILQNSTMVEKLGQKSREVGRVVEIISQIAEQSNLLSLNAAIEAARAGEQGKGFTVVADEIKILAEGSSKAVQEITGLVQEMQEETTLVVDSMKKSAREAEGGKEGIRHMESTLTDIVGVIENVMEHSQKITEMINAQSQRFAKIAHSIQDINAVSEESAASTEEVSASTEEQTASMEQVSATFKELAAMAEELKGMVEKFKIR
ncbi:MAG TPA: methyl-accepting chemotaxis protein [bacterium]|nr:methyl-accepting chemotaxis protein [bacterium]